MLRNIIKYMHHLLYFTFPLFLPSSQYFLIYLCKSLFTFSKSHARILLSLCQRFSCIIIHLDETIYVTKKSSWQKDLYIYTSSSTYKHHSNLVFEIKETYRTNIFAPTFVYPYHCQCLLN